MTCHHGTPGGCGRCPMCRRALPDDDGVLCGKCTGPSLRLGDLVRLTNKTLWSITSFWDAADGTALAQLTSIENPATRRSVRVDHLTKENI